MSEFEKKLELKTKYSGLQSEMIAVLKIKRFVLEEEVRINDELIELEKQGARD